MNSILLTVIILASIGLLSGIILCVAAILMAVKKDETAEKIEAVLPGANCGACGFSGCSGYADALAKGDETSTVLCAPGGAAAAEQVAQILGKSAGDFKRKYAVVLCRGNNETTEKTYDYNGIKSCVSANRLFGGESSCKFGCIGYGDCVSVCDFGAIKVENGLANVDTAICSGCGKCVTACPKRLIELHSNPDSLDVFCKNKSKGANTKKDCKVGCVGCMLCVKACEHNAIEVVDFCAVIDNEKCIGCGKCADVCPQKCIF